MKGRPQGSTKLSVLVIESGESGNH